MTGLWRIMAWIFLALLAGWAVGMGTLIWRDLRRLGITGQEAGRLILLGLIDPLRYWYFERPLRLPEAERTAWLAALAHRLGLSDVRATHCPLCGAEIAEAWAVDERGKLKTAPGPIHCPKCDFRLDACRHCRYFQPAGAYASYALSGTGLSWTHGRCTYYKTMQPVEALVASPDMARRMRERGYTQLRGPTPINDSYIPLENCNAFALEVKHLQHSGTQKPSRRQRLALRVLARTAPASPSEPPPSEPSEEEQWLL